MSGTGAMGMIGTAEDDVPQRRWPCIFTYYTCSPVGSSRVMRTMLMPASGIPRLIEPGTRVYEDSSSTLPPRQLGFSRKAMTAGRQGRTHQYHSSS